jgi:hypothetical protein
MKANRFLFLVILAVWTSQAALGEQPKVLANQVGYDPQGQKLAVILGHPGDEFLGFVVKTAATGENVLSGVPRHAGPVMKWKDWDFWTIDWSPVDREGTYIIECASPGGIVRSHPILVQKNVLERNTLSDVIYYLKGQRSSGLLDKADRSMTFEGQGGRVDVHGGWFDATGDYGKHLSHLSFATYFNPQQISLTAWSLFKSLRELERRGDPNFRQYERRLLDEALFGADYLVRIKDPKGSFYISVSGRGPGKKPEDRRITPKAERHIILTAETKDKIRDYGRERIPGEAAYEAGYREGAGLCIAALAMASAAGASGDFTSADYLKAAEDAFAFLEKNNLRFINDGKENIIDDDCALTAATELYRATKNPRYKAAATARASSLMGRLTVAGGYENYWRADDKDRPFFHPVDAGLPVVSLLEYCGIADSPMRERLLDAVRKSVHFELWVTGEVVNPFGYSRQYVQSKGGARRTSFFFPHDTETAPWWQGENARLGSMAAAARLAARYFGESGDNQDKALARRLGAFAQNQLNWILGLNPYDACMLQDKGRNNLPYMFFDSYEYTNAPGGICNGITAGYTDENDIDFGLHYATTGKDDDWRWAEQWLPHAAWYIYAISIGE